MSVKKLREEVKAAKENTNAFAALQSQIDAIVRFLSAPKKK